MRKLTKFLADNGLLIAFTTLFVLCLAGQALTGHAAYNDTQATSHLPQLGLWSYVTTGTFLQAMFSNWQAAILQLGSLIILGIFLRQWGAPHSLKPGKRPKDSDEPEASSQSSAKPNVSTKRAPEGQRSRGQRSKSLRKRSWLHNNSLSVVFVSLFVLVFLLHLYSGAASYNHQLALTHQPALTVRQYFVSAEFWFTTLQTWEAEYMAIALYVFLSIFLRQQGSPESKPADAPNSDTDDPNK